jgi:RecA-family ATPase
MDDSLFDNGNGNEFDFNKESEDSKFRVALNKAIICGTNTTVEKDGWLLEPFIHEKTISILDGPSGVGKSLFALEICYTLATGKNFFGMPSTLQPTNVLYINAEDTKYQLFKRISKIAQYYPKTNNFFWLSAFDKNLKFYTTRLFVRKSNKIQLTLMGQFLNEQIREYNIKFVVLDSIINFFGLDENNTEDVAMFYEYLKEIIRDNDCSFLLVHHQTKETLKGRAGIFRGSEIFRDQARTRMMMSNDGEYKKLEIEKSNYFSPLLDEFPIFLEFVNGFLRRIIETGQAKAIFGPIPPKYSFDE